MSKSKHPLYPMYGAMIQRCHNVNNAQYKNYGARGITVCDEWRESFEAFVRDMGERPDGFSIDRIDNDKGYFPDNCRWADWMTQAQNRRGYKGAPCADIVNRAGGARVVAKELGLKHQAVYQWQKVPPKHVKRVADADGGRFRPGCP